MTIDVNMLGQALDTTWGRSSTPKTASYSVKFKMLGPDRIMASYQAIVNFASERQMIEMKRAYNEESTSIVNEVLKQVKGAYKELSGETLKTKQVSMEDSVEIIGFNLNSPKRTAYYRSKVIFEVA